MVLASQRQRSRPKSGLTALENVFESGLATGDVLPDGNIIYFKKMNTSLEEVTEGKTISSKRNGILYMQLRMRSPMASRRSTIADRRSPLGSWSLASPHPINGQRSLVSRF